MINPAIFVKSKEWKEFREYFNTEMETKPLNLKLDGMDNDRIALEVRAEQLAVKKIKKFVNKFERLGQITKRDEQPFR